MSTDSTDRREHRTSVKMASATVLELRDPIGQEPKNRTKLMNFKGINIFPNLNDTYKRN